MADYYQLMIRAIASLDKSTGESRRALYGRARTALVDSLRSLDPLPSESEITRERLLLEEAIRKVEAEALRRPPVKARQPNPIANEGLTEQGGRDEKPAPDGDRSTTPGQEPAPGVPLIKPEAEAEVKGVETSAEGKPEVTAGETSADHRPEVKGGDTSADHGPEIKGRNTSADDRPQAADDRPQVKGAEASADGSSLALRDRSPERKAWPAAANRARRLPAELDAMVPDLDPFRMSLEKAIRSAEADAASGPGVKRDGTSAPQRLGRDAANAQDLDRFRLSLEKATRGAEAGAGAAGPEAESDGRRPAYIRDSNRELEGVPQDSNTARRPLAGTPAVPDLDRFKPRPEPHGFTMPRRELDPPVSGPHPRQGSRPFSPQPPRAQPAGAKIAAAASQGRSKKALISAILSGLIVLALGLTLYWLRDPLKAVFTRKPAGQLQQQPMDGSPNWSLRLHPKPSSNPTTSSP